MPVYSYRCENCGVRFERKQHFDDPQLEQCPECGKKTLRKIYLPVGILFKGPGFYSTDHRSASGANGQYSKKEDKKSDSGDTPAKEKSSESKSTSDD